MLFPPFFTELFIDGILMNGAFAVVPKPQDFTVISRKFVHRYGLSNTLAWLRDRKPTGHQSLSAIDSSIDGAWIDYLERNGISDTLYLILQPDM